MAEESYRKAIDTINNYKKELAQLSSKIWQKPELNFEEYEACHVLTEFLEKTGFIVEREYCNIETAFVAV